MDIGKIIKDLAPFLVLLAFIIPYIEKSIKKAKHPKHRQASVHQSGRNRAHDFSSQMERDARNGAEALHSYDSLPEEGIPATAGMDNETETPPADRIDNDRDDRRSRLRRAIIYSEILNRKQF